MNDKQIRHMVDRFLMFRFPDDFRPDGGIKFTAGYDNGTPDGGRHQPMGTNLLDASQAKAMVLHMIEGLPE